MWDGTTVSMITIISMSAIIQQADGGGMGTLHTMGIRWIQYRSCFDGVSFKVNFRFSKFEEVESYDEGVCQ